MLHEEIIAKRFHLSRLMILRHTDVSRGIYSLRLPSYLQGRNDNAVHAQREDTNLHQAGVRKAK